MCLSSFVDSSSVDVYIIIIASTVAVAIVVQDPFWLRICFGSFSFWIVLILASGIGIERSAVCLL